MSEKSQREAGGFFLYRLNKEGQAEFLLLRNAEHGAWGVPKGHREDSDQDLFACAIRETREETGLEHFLVHSGFRAEISYDAERKGQSYRKRVVYFLARLENGTLRQSEEHDAADWLPKSKARILLKFENLVAILDKACEYLETVCKVCVDNDLE